MPSEASPKKRLMEKLNRAHNFGASKPRVRGEDFPPGSDLNAQYLQAGADTKEHLIVIRKKYQIE